MATISFDVIQADAKCTATFTYTVTDSDGSAVVRATQYKAGAVTGTNAQNKAKVTQLMAMGFNLIFDGTKLGSASGANTTTTLSGSKTITKTRSTQSKKLSVTRPKDATDTTEAKSTNISISAKSSYSITYNGNGGTGAPQSQTKWFNESLTLSAGKPTKAGYTFTKWKATNGTLYDAGAVYTANAGTTMTAQWTANKYTISYDLNGGSGTVAPQTKTYDTALNLRDGAGVTRYGLLNGAQTEYVLKGWATTKARADVGTVDYAPGGPAPNITATVTYYAVWELKYVYPLITDFKAIRTDTASIQDTAETDAGEYLYITFNWTGCSQDGGETMITPTCKITIDGVETTQTLTSGGSFEYKPNTAYSQDASHTVEVLLEDPSRATSQCLESILVGTAILPIDLYGEGINTWMGIMHPYVQGQDVTMPNVYMDSLRIELDDVSASGTDYNIIHAATLLGWDIIESSN